MTFDTRFTLPSFRIESENDRISPKRPQHLRVWFFVCCFTSDRCKLHVPTININIKRHNMPIKRSLRCWANKEECYNLSTPYASCKEYVPTFWLKWYGKRRQIIPYIATTMVPKAPIPLSSLCLRTLFQKKSVLVVSSLAPSPSRPKERLGPVQHEMMKLQQTLAEIKMSVAIYVVPRFPKRLFLA